MIETILSPFVISDEPWSLDELHVIELTDVQILILFQIQRTGAVLVLYLLLLELND